MKKNMTIFSFPYCFHCLLLLIGTILLLSGCGGGGNSGTEDPVNSTAPVSDPGFVTKVYPSTATAWVIPGYHAENYESMGYPISTKEQLIDWELSHADVALGSTYDKSAADKIISLGYIYTQKIDFSPTSVGFDLREYAERVNENYEDYFLHFSEDTVVQGIYPDHSIYTPLNRRPWVAGWTAEEDHSGFLVWKLPPYEIQPFKGSEKGGCVFIYMPEKFDQVEFVLKSAAITGRLIVKYPSGIDVESGVVNQWNTSDSDMMDGTNGLKISGVISWQPASDWVKAATYDPDNKTGQFFGNKYIKEGKKFYIVKICRVDEDINDQPVVQDIMIKNFMPYINKPNQKRLIRGWDPENDRNGDGYVDASEFNVRVNTTASARFRYESRVTPLGNMWGKTSNFQRPDFLNPSYRAAIANVISQEWIKNSLAGAYNDDVFKLDGINLVGIGGKTVEHGVMIDDPDFKEKYQDAFLDTIREIKYESGSPWVAANTSAENIFERQNNRMKYIDAFDTFLREDYIRPGQGLDGYFGIAKMWDTFALSQANKKTVVIAHAGWTGSIPMLNTKSAWESRISTGLAMYYLVNIPGKTFYTSWNNSYNYGSGNTEEGNFYKLGIPKNIAYQPSLMLAVDIGRPTMNIQKWPDQTVQPVMYTAKTTDEDYAVIGDSTQLILTHPDIATFDQVGAVPVTPSNIYYAWQSENKNAIAGVDFPKQMIIARDYSNGLVLYHTDFFGGNSDFMSVTHELTLPGYYRRVNYDGTFEDAANTISLTGYEGAVLVKFE
ncbi:MAG: hypothetical protein L3J84_02365 [Gammaproteobacteria bacterium]|nr:hypothetical protein [Gammaproteobacteria bacterium]